MKKVILNKCYGGFDVSPEAYKLYAKKKGLEIYPYTLEFTNERKVYYKKADVTDVDEKGLDLFTYYALHDYGDTVQEIDDYLRLDEDSREDKTLIEVVEELGEKASGRFGKLVIVEIPDDVAEDYVINDYDGIETLHKRVEEY